MNCVFIPLYALASELPKQLPTALKQVLMEDSSFQSSLEDTTSCNYKRDMEEIKKKTQNSLIRKIEGYKTQATEWIATTKTLEENVLPDFKERIESVEKSWTTKEKAIDKKSKTCLYTHNNIHEQLEEIKKIKIKYQEQLDQAEKEAKKYLISTSHNSSYLTNMMQSKRNKESKKWKCKR